MLYMDQKLWPNFEPLLPPHLNKIVLGPMHGAFRLVAGNLTQSPPVAHFTSAYTCLSDEEIQDIFTYPTMATVRKFCEVNSMGPAWALNQASMVTKSENLKEYQIVISGTPDCTEPVCLFADQTLKQMGVSSKVSLRQALSGTWVSTIFDEFLDYRQRLIRKL